MKRDVWLTHDWSRFCSQTQPQGCSSILMSLKALVAKSECFEFLNWFICNSTEPFLNVYITVAEKENIFVLEKPAGMSVENAIKCW